MNLKFVFFALIVCSIVGCKRFGFNKSETRSLDNFAAGSRVRENHCAGSEDHKSVDFSFVRNDNGDVIPQEKWPTAFGDAIKSIPTDLLRIFSDKAILGGHMILSSMATAQCSGADACVNVVRFKNSQDAVLSIVMSNDEKIIRFELVRQFGYFFSQKLSHFHSDSSKSGMLNAKARLAKNFLKDIIEKKIYKMDALEKYFGSESLKLLLMELVKPSIVDAGIITKGDDYLFFDRLDFKFPGENTVDDLVKEYRLNSFLDLVLGESFDSYFCNAVAGSLNKNTQKIMEAEFKRTFDIFPSVYDEITGMISMALLQKAGVNASIRKISSRSSAAGFSLSEGEQPSTEAPINVETVENFAGNNNSLAESQLEVPEKVMQEDSEISMTTTGITESDLSSSRQGVAVSDTKEGHEQVSDKLIHKAETTPEKLATSAAKTVAKKIIEVEEKQLLNAAVQGGVRQAEREVVTDAIKGTGSSITPGSIAKGAVKGAVKSLALDSMLIASDGSDSVTAKTVSVGASGAKLAVQAATTEAQILVLGPTELIDVAGKVTEQANYVAKAEVNARKVYRENKDAIERRALQNGDDPLTENEFVTVAKNEALIYKQKAQKYEDGRLNPLVRIAEVFNGTTPPPRPPGPHSIDYYYKEINKFPGGRRQYK